MKLYTEKQVKKLFRDYTFLRNDTINGICKTLQPIELPSDEEAAKAARRYCKDTPDNDPIRILAFIEGAKWVINHFKQQDNGK